MSTEMRVAVWAIDFFILGWNGWALLTRRYRYVVSNLWAWFAIGLAVLSIGLLVASA